MARSGNRGRRGIILLIVTGVTAMLALLSLGVLGLGKALSAASLAAREAAATGLAAASGMEYAAARLSICPVPRHTAGAAGREDDWTFRDGPLAALEEAHNPSYARGDAWADVSIDRDDTDNDLDGIADNPGEVDRVWRPDDLPGTDLDGDGRHSAWSGRLRGGRNPFALRFLLRIGSPEGGIPVNGGTLIGDPYLDGYDNDSDGQIDETNERLGDVYSQAGGGVGNAIPDHRDPHVPLHAEIARQVDSLSEILGCSAFPGIRLIEQRPKGGYRSWEDLSGRLQAVGIPGGDLAALRSFLDLGPYDGSVEGGSPWIYADCVYVRPNLAAAPREVLEASFLRLEVDVHKPSFPGEPDGWTIVNPDLGLDFGAEIRRPGYAAADLFPRECEAAARVALACRQDGGPFEGRLADALLALKAEVFQNQADALDTPHTPRFREEWLARKALATAAVPGAGASDAPVRFRIASAGETALARPARRVLEGGYRVAERLRLDVQEDFELMGGGHFLARLRGIVAVDDPPPHVRRGCPAGSPWRPPVVSLPGWNWRGVTTTRPPPLTPFRRDSGSLALASKEEGLSGAQLYWAFNEDFDGQENKIRPAPYGEMWPFWQTSPAVPWIPSATPSDTNLKYRTPLGVRGAGPYFMTSTGGFIPGISLGSPSTIPSQYLMGRISVPGMVPSTETVPPPPPFVFPPQTVPRGVRGMSIEARFGPRGFLRIWKEGIGPSYLEIFAKPKVRPGPAGDEKGIEFTVNLKWRVFALISTPPSPIWGFSASNKSPRKIRSWFVAEDPREPWSRVLLTLERRDVGGVLKTRVSLYVNGSGKDADGSDMAFLFDGLEMPPASADYTDIGQMLSGHYGWMAFHDLDELRLREGALPGPPPEEDRYVRAGTYTSPLYRMGGACRPLFLRWEGAALPGLPASVGLEIVGCDEGGAEIRSVRRAGSPGALLAVDDAAWPASVRALRYRVHLDCSAAPGILRQTPVLDALTVGFRRAGASPAWSSWEGR